MTLRITPEHSWIEYDEYFRVWIDFNQDADFDDPGEMVLEAIGNTAVSGDVLIPLDATLGPTRMRISLSLIHI